MLYILLHDPSCLSTAQLSEQIGLQPLPMTFGDHLARAGLEPRAPNRPLYRLQRAHYTLLLKPRPANGVLALQRTAYRDTRRRRA